MDQETSCYFKMILSNRSLIFNPNGNLTDWECRFLKGIIQKIDNNGIYEFSEKQKAKLNSIIEVSKPFGQESVKHDPELIDKLKDIRDRRDKRSQGTYRYAFTKKNDLVFIEDLVDNIDRHSTFTCPSCSNDLIPRFKKKASFYTNHFYHKQAGSCSNETYLHKVAIQLFNKQYTHCCTNSQPLSLFYKRQSRCGVYPEFQLDCPIESKDTYDLTTIVPEIAIEKSFNNIIPDIRLYSHNKPRVLLIEIAVTHPCDTNKLEKGFPIIEFSIKTEEDLEYLKVPFIKEIDTKIRFFNFKKMDASIKTECADTCSHRIYVFGIHKSGKCILCEEKPSIVTKPKYENKFMYCEILGAVLKFKETAGHIFRKKVQEYHFSRTKIKNCFTCRHHGGDGYENAVFCFISKNSVGSNEAATCNNYQQVDSLIQCNIMNERNDKYKEKQSSMRFINHMMGDRLF